MVGDVVVVVTPSPKDQSYLATVPTGDDEPEASKVVGVLGGPGVTVKAAVGAWSGVMAISNGSDPTVTVAPTAFVAVLIGVIEPDPLVATHAVAPSGLTAIPAGTPPTVTVAPMVLLAVSI